jgi:hypothetical protein
MAIDHCPEQTLTRHRFSRRGDLWKHALPLIRPQPIAFAVFDVLEIELVWQSGAYRVPVPDPNCGALKLTRDDAYALTFQGGGVHDQSGQQNRPHRIACQACNRSLDVTVLLKDMKARDLDALLTTGPLRRWAPKPQMFIVAQTEDGDHSIGRTVPDALDPITGPVFDLKAKLSRIEAMGRDHAQELVDQHHASMTWRDVAITRELDPVDLAWHGGPLAEWEKRKLAGRQQAKVIQKRKDLDRELEVFRRKRRAELGL